MIRTIVAMLSFGLAGTLPAVAQDPATPEEVVAKVKEAAVYLEKEGKDGLSTFDKAESPFVWKDTYVFVIDCAIGLTVAHPEASTRDTVLATITDKAGKRFGPLMCEAAKRPDGGWVEYVWPKPVAASTGELSYAVEPSRKVTYMLAVPGQPYQIGAGIYNDTLTVDKLDQLAE